MEEVALRERAVALEPEALSEIYDTFSGKIYSYIYHRTGDAAVAEDLTADVFVRMLEAIKDNRSWTTSIKSSGWSATATSSRPRTRRSAPRRIRSVLDRSRWPAS